LRRASDISGFHIIFINSLRGTRKVKTLLAAGAISMVAFAAMAEKKDDDVCDRIQIKNSNAYYWDHDNCSADLVGSPIVRKAKAKAGIVLPPATDPVKDKVTKEDDKDEKPDEGEDTPDDGEGDTQGESDDAPGKGGKGDNGGDKPKGDNGHGNDADGTDESNPGKGGDTQGGDGGAGGGKGDNGKGKGGN
jgi:hypothetical protein